MPSQLASTILSWTRSTVGKPVVLLAFLFFATAWNSIAGAENKFSSGEILVKFKQDISTSDIDFVNEAYGATIIKFIDAIDLYLLKIPSNLSIQEIVQQYNNNPLVEYAEPNYVGGSGNYYFENTFFRTQWHLNNDGQSGGLLGADIDAVAAWEMSTGSNSVVLAILDTGIHLDHPELQGRILPGYDFVNNDSNPQADHPHGTLVAGISAANSNNQFSVAGVDHKVKILPVKVLNSHNLGSTFDLAQGLIYAAKNGAHVINMSLIDYPNSTTLHYALQTARDAGAILVACAGNGGIGNADHSGPGASPLTISVGATDHFDKRAPFSATGIALDVVAPGKGIRTLRWNSDDDSFGVFHGCSAATPIVSGIITTMLSVNPVLTHDDVRDILVSTAEDMVGPAFEDTPGKDVYFGHGRVNMRSALEYVVAQSFERPMLAVQNDINNNGSMEIVVLDRDDDSNELIAITRDARENTLINEIQFNNNLIPIKLKTVNDINANGANEIVLLGTGPTLKSPDHLPRVAIHDGLTGDFLSSVTFKRSLETIDFLMMPDQNGNGGPEVAVLGRSNVNNSISVTVKDIVTNERLTVINFNSAHTPKSLAKVNDINGNGIIELIVLGKDGTPASGDSVEIRDSFTGNLVNAIQYGSNFEVVDLTVLPDVNANNADDIVALRSPPSSLRINDSFSDAVLVDIRFNPNLELIPQQVLVIPDIDNDGVPELAIRTANLASQQTKFEIRNIITKELINNIFFYTNFSAQGDGQLISDLNGNNTPELVLLTRNRSNGKLNVFVKDTLSDTLINTVRF